MPGFANKLLTGLAELLAAEGVGTWSPTGVYSSSATAIVIMRLPSAPDKAISLTDYFTSGNAKLTDSIMSVQARVRGDRTPGTVNDMRDAIHAALHGRGSTTLGTAPNQVIVGQINAVSEAPLGPDANDRYERTLNFDINVNRPDNARLE